MAEKEEPQATGAAGSGQPDVAIDTSEASRGTQKVELDLEDAPFLEEEEEVVPDDLSLPGDMADVG